MLTRYHVRNKIKPSNGDVSVEMQYETDKATILFKYFIDKHYFMMK
jgi:hypothetical protein